MVKAGTFQKGNQAARGFGRPSGSKDQIKKIRARILRVVKRRVLKEKDLETVSTTDLLKFLAQIMPKEMQVDTGHVTYISNIPREEVKEDVKKQLTNHIEAEVIATVAQPEEEKPVAREDA